MNKSGLRKRVVFDATVLITGHISGHLYKTGLYRVAYELLKNLYKKELFELVLFDVYFREREILKYLHGEFPDCLRIKNFSFWYQALIFPIGNYLDTIRQNTKKSNGRLSVAIFWALKNILVIIEKIAKKIEKYFFQNRLLMKEIKNCDVYLSTYFPIPQQIRSYKKIKKIYLIHDMIPILYPEFFSSRFNQILLKEVVDNINVDSSVICVSESTKNDFLRYKSSFDHDHVYATLLAGAECFRPVKSKDKEFCVRAKLSIPQGKIYFLSVCTIEPRKNILFLINAFERLLMQTQMGSKPILVLTGAYGWESDILLRKIELLNSRFPDSVIVTGFVTDEDLAVLYSNTIAFIYPSLYEGFGLPPLEAMQCGAPIITSNNSSLPEVVGDAGIMISAHDEDGLVNALIACLDNDIVDKMRKKSIMRAKLFSWDNTVTNIINIINRSN